jgi:hypothetical protein
MRNKWKYWKIKVRETNGPGTLTSKFPTFQKERVEK